MKQIGIFSVALLAIGLSSVAYAQENFSPEMQKNICALSGKCGDDNADDGSMAVGPERGFKLMVPGNTTPSAVHTANAVFQPVRHAAAHPRVSESGRAEMRLSFERGSADLTPGANAEADAWVQALNGTKLTGERLVVEGHTDSLGGRDSNLDLSQRRAQTVVQYLVSHGVTADRLDVRGYGFDHPRPGLSTSDPRNRRVAIVRAS